jgi:hypothetical protein
MSQQHNSPWLSSRSKQPVEPYYGERISLLANSQTSQSDITAINPATRPKAEDDPANGTAIPIPATVANVPLWQRLGPLSRGFQAYGRSQRKRPYATQFCSSLVIYFLGDLSAQNINGDEYDPKRTLRALVISAGSSIPSYKWYVLPQIWEGCCQVLIKVYVPGQ